MKNPIIRELTKDFLKKIKPNDIVFAELIFDGLYASRTRIWAIIDDEYILLEALDQSKIKKIFSLADEAKYVISVVFNDNFYSTWDPKTYNRFYFRKDNKTKFDKIKKQFVYDNKYLAKTIIPIGHFNGYDEKEFAKIIKQNFPKIQKEDLNKRLSRLKQLYFSAEPAQFYHPLDEPPEYASRRESSIKEVVLLTGNFTKNIIGRFFEYEEARVFESVLRFVDLLKKETTNLLNDNHESSSTQPNSSEQNLEEEILYSHGDFSLKYDVDYPETPNEIKMAKEFVDSLGVYCLNTKSKTLLNLLDNKQQLTVSEVLRAISFNGEAPYYSPEDDFNNFHSFVTRYMIESGWLTDFSDIILSISNISMLRLSTFKYILANWNWIVSIYDSGVLEELAINYGKISLENSAIEESALRETFIRMALKQEIIRAEQELEERVLSIIKKRL